MTNPIVTFRTLSNGSVVALAGNHDALAVNVDKVCEYMSKLKELTGGTKVEFNDTFRQICKDRVFYTFEPAVEFDMDNKPYVPEVVEVVLLSNDKVAMNINGAITICTAEEGNAIYATKEDATKAAKKNALDVNSKYLNYLFEARQELKKILKSMNENIDEALNFKNSL